MPSPSPSRLREGRHHLVPSRRREGVEEGRNYLVPSRRRGGLGEGTHHLVPLPQAGGVRGGDLHLVRAKTLPSHSLLNRKARSTAAASLRLRVRDFEAFAAERFNEINRRAAHQIKADGVNDQQRPFALRLNIIGLNRVRQAKAILKAGTAATFNRQTQNRVLAQLGCDFSHAARGVRCHGNDFSVGHGLYVSHTADKEKGRQSFRCQPQDYTLSQR